MEVKRSQLCINFATKILSLTSLKKGTRTKMKANVHEIFVPDEGSKVLKWFKFISKMAKVCLQKKVCFSFW